MSEKMKIEDMPFEMAMTELENVVKKLESGQVPLEEAIKFYEQGDALKKRCEKLLSNAQLKVEEIYQSKDGSIEKKPSELEKLFS